MNVLLVGGSGFLSGAVAREALSRGHSVHAITRGTRPVPEGVQAHIADRHDHSAFRTAVDEIMRQTGGSVDLVADVIPFTPEDAEQDLEVFAGRCAAYAFVSTDFVYDPAARKFPQSEADAAYFTEGYGGAKRAAEEVLIAAGSDSLPWTILRPGHIYGPGSKLGCLPPLGRDEQLPDRLRRGEQIPLVGGGRFLQQPVFVRDLARVIVDVGSAADAVGTVCNVAGPDVVESVEYYRIIADVIGVALETDEVPVDAYLSEHPDRASFICHRFYELGALAAAGIDPPETSLSDGLREHVQSLL